MSDEWQEAGSGDSITWDKEKPLTGTYTAKKENVGPNESNVYQIQVKDETYSVWGSTVLDTKFAEIPVGSEVKVEALGVAKSPKTGREYNDFKVMYKPAVPKAVAEVFPDAEAV